MSSYNLNGIAIDKTKKQILLYKDGNQSVMPFESLIGSEILEDGISFTRTDRSSQIVGAAVGGALLGGVGAIVGALTASGTSEDKVRTVTLRIISDDFGYPNHDVVFLDHPNGIEKSSSKYQDAADHVADWHSRLTIILRRLSQQDTKKTTGQQTQAMESVADELAKLAKLKEKGVLNDKEFAAQKAKLLKG